MALASIIICTRNRADSLRRTLDSLNGVNIPEGLSAEVLVVDNGSTDDTAAVVRQCKFDKAVLKYLSEPQAGQSRSRNLGMAEAKGDIIVFTDDDVIPSADWLSSLCAPILDGKADAVAGCVRLAPHLVAPWMSTFHRQWLADTCGLDSVNPGRLVGANMAFSRSVLERVPAFDVELGPGALGFGDDTLFSEQLKAAGYRLTTAFDAVVEHHFLENRLQPDSWIQAAKKLGKVDAYIGHHWEHAVWPLPRRKVCEAFLILARHRVLFLFRKSKLEVPQSLLNAERYFHARLHYLQESKRPRNYDKHGLARLQPAR